MSFQSKTMIKLFQTLGAVDYLEVSKAFDIIILRDIPKMELTKKNRSS